MFSMHYRCKVTYSLISECCARAKSLVPLQPLKNQQSDLLWTHIWTQISLTNPLPEEGCIRFSVEVRICSSAILNLSLHIAESQLFGSNFKAH